MRQAVNKRRISTVKVKSNDGEYSRGGVICKANVHSLNITLTTSKTPEMPLFFPSVALLPLHHDVELNLFELHLLLDLFLFLSIYDCSKHLS